MAVLIEAISVVVKRSSVNEKFSGGWQAFVDDVPNDTFCADDEIARIGFMSPADVESYIQHLEALGLTYLRDDKAHDMVVVDQQRGIVVSCDWAETGRISLDGSSDKMVIACRATGSTLDNMISPGGWQYENSLSQTFNFAPSEYVEKSLKFLRHEDGVDVYVNILTGKEVYLGRTGER